MTRFVTTMVVLLAACGGSDDDNTSTDGGDTTSGLTCEAVSYCSTWSATSTEIPEPAERGGTIADGIYRLERGTFGVQLFQFAGNRVNQIGDSFENRSGTYSTADGTISFSYTSRCSKDGTTQDTNNYDDRPYFANGDTLLIALADKGGGGVVWYEFKKLSIDQICTENANVSCNVTNCSCAVVTNGFGTVTSGTKSCSSS